MSDSANISNTKLNKEQRKLIYDALATNIIKLQEYRLDVIKPDGAVLFEYLCYNSYKRFVEDASSSGYFYHSYERINEEYGIGKDRVKKIISQLKQIGVLETKVCGFPKNTHYRIRFDFLATTEVVVKLFRTTPKRTKEIADHYVEIANLVKLREDTEQESLAKKYPLEAWWFEQFKQIYYQERTRFNKTVPTSAAIKKVQPKPREATFRNINDAIYLVYNHYDGKRHTDDEAQQNGVEIFNAFRVYCALLFLYTCEDPSSSQELNAIGEMEFATILVNYAQGIRDPIAYFVAKQDDSINFIRTNLWDGVRDYLDLTTGYFYS